MPHYESVYMRSKKLARRGEGPSSSGGPESALVVEEPIPAPAVEEPVAVETSGAAVQEYVEMAGAPVVTTALVSSSKMIESSSSSGGSEGFGSSATLDEDTESDGDDVGPTVEAATPVVEDDAWYQNILDFIHQEAEGDVGAPPDFTQAYIPRDEVQVLGPCRDEARAELAVAALAATG